MWSVFLNQVTNIATYVIYIILFLIILNAFSDPLCSKVCWHNRQVPSLEAILIAIQYFNASHMHYDLHHGLATYTD